MRLLTKKWALALSAVLGAAALGLLAPHTASAGAFVPGDLRDYAAAHPNEKLRVIVVAKDPATIRNHHLRNTVEAVLGRVKAEYQVVDGAAIELSGRHVALLARLPFVRSITPDRQVVPTGDVNLATMWPQAVGVDRLWNGVDSTGAVVPSPQAPAIAVVDSGVDASRAADFGGRVVASVNLASRSPGSTGDDNGHGTMVAGIAAGAATGHVGAAPNAPIVSLDVVDADGSALTSDVIAAADWIYRNRFAHGIRVANFSLRSAGANYGLADPLNAAVRRLWLTGTVVVAAAGNDGPQRMLYAPASDPFVITVGAVDVNGTAGTADDFAAPWSSNGHTAEGFRKPELGAPGRYLVGPVPPSSTLPTALPGRVTSPGYMWMSGTSFAAPVVSGVAAQLLARHPDWTPDQVKGALMLTAKPLADLSAGVGEVDAAAAAQLVSPPSPNENLHGFVVRNAAGDPVFDGDAWNQHVATNASWTSASWTSASWTSATWTSATWTSATWTSATWTSASSVQ
jgi:serine protease AprX